MKDLQANNNNLLLQKITELEKRIQELEEKQEKDNTQIYEHLQFMNYSQKIKKLENAVANFQSQVFEIQRRFFR